MAHVRVRVPGSTSNLSHGFDCMGLAVAIYNEITVSESNVHQVTADAPGLADFGQRIRHACSAAWSCDVPVFELSVDGAVPMSRGLGSSATILVGVVAALQQLTGREIDRDEVVRLTATLEGHPDNVVAATMGGFTIAGPNRDQQLTWRCLAPPRNCVAVLAIPETQQRTEDARSVLPSEVPAPEAVIGWQRSALIVAALAQDDPRALRDLLGDGWHERHRAPGNPGLAEAMTAARDAGAWGSILSGSGSTVLSFAAPDQAELIASAIATSYANAGITCTTLVRPFDCEGLTVLDSSIAERNEA